MEKRSLVRLFDKWASDYWDRTDDSINDNLRYYIMTCEEKRDINPAMAKDRRIAMKTMEIIEHTLCFGIEKRQIATLKQAGDFLRLQIPVKKGSVKGSYYQIMVDTKYNSFMYPVYVPLLVCYPFGEIWRSLHCEAFHISRVPQQKWKKIIPISDAVSVVSNSLDTVIGKKSKDLTLHFEKEGIWLNIFDMDLNGARVPGLRLRELKSL
jgi:hypothetical protein